MDDYFQICERLSSALGYKWGEAESLEVMLEQVKQIKEENKRLNKKLSESNEMVLTAYEALLGDTDYCARHSEYCYRTVSHADISKCVCGLKEALDVLRPIADKVRKKIKRSGNVKE